jgi:RNA polymerase sigma-70 factor, ECF subfamily
MRFRALAPSAAESLGSSWVRSAKQPSASSADKEPDKQLMEAAQRGDRTAFADIIQRHQGAIYGYLRSRLLEPADAEDLSQEVFLRCYVSPARFDHSVMVRPWLIGIARNLLREHVRRVKRRREVAWTELCLELEEMVGLADERYDEIMRHLPNCLASLGQSARQALDLRYQAKLRLSEIGEKLHRSEGAVKLLMFRARQALRHCLDTTIEKQTGT